MNTINPFHLAIPVKDLRDTRAFYRDVLGCAEGRTDTRWVDLNFYGHQLVLHLTDARINSREMTNPVDGHDVPVPHFGVVLDWEDWQKLADRLVRANTEFVIEPHVRFEGQPGEQATLFFLDPSGNALEFKSFRQLDQLFAS